MSVSLKSNRPSPKIDTRSLKYMILRATLPLFLLFGGALLCLCAFAMPSYESVEIARAATSKPFSIEDVQLGWRVVGENPLGPEDDASEPNEQSWKKVVLHHRSEEGSLIEIEFLRPNAWFAKWRAEVGRTIDLSLSEPGKSGIARVVAVEPCPQIKPGTGPVVTGLFRHVCEEGELVRVEIGDELEPIISTFNHQFWSSSRNKFIQAADLQTGEQLVCANESLVYVKRVTAVEGAEPVFNIETHNHHVYSVGTNGMLVHNMCATQKPDDDEFLFHGTRSDQTVTTKGLDINEVRRRGGPDGEAGFSLSNRETATGFSENPLRAGDGDPTLLKIRKSTLAEKDIVFEQGVELTDAGEVRILPLDFGKFKPGDFEVD